VRLGPNAFLFPEGDSSNWPLALFDWTTASIRIFEEQEPFRVLKAKPAELLSDHEHDLLETLTHETVHHYQAAVTGFCYRISYEMWKLTAEAFTKYPSILEIHQNRYEYAERLNALMQPLWAPGDQGLSSISIIESAAFLAQKRSQIAGLTATLFNDILNEDAPDTDYHLAYDIASEDLGPHALALLPLVTYLALLTSDPASVFRPLTRTFSVQASRTNTTYNLELGLTLLKTEFKELFVGTGADTLNSGSYHPVLARTLRRLQDAASHTERPLEVAMAWSLSGDSDIAKLPLTFFIPGGMVGKISVAIPENWAFSDHPDNEATPAHVHYICGASLALQQDLQDFPPPPMTERPIVAIRPEYPIRNLICTSENRDRETVVHIASLFKNMEQDAKQVQALRGHYFLTFPDEEFSENESPFSRQDIQEFLREFFEEIPHFLYYLSDLPEAGSLDALLAAFAPHSLQFDDSGGFMVELSIEVLTVTVSALRAAARHAVGVGLPPTVVLGHIFHLQPLTKQLVTSLVLEGIADPSDSQGHSHGLKSPFHRR
jgi:hypothetical protein